MTLVRDYSWCHPKKRPLPSYFEYSVNEVDENEEPQDLSLKTRQRLLDVSSPKPPIDEKKVYPGTQGATLAPKLQAHLIVNTPPSRIPSIPSLLDRPHTPKVEQKPFPSHNEGLRLISEVASKVGEFEGKLSGYAPSYKLTSGQNKSAYAPSTPRSPMRMALKERDARWPYHPYMPLYSIPISNYSHSLSVSSNKEAMHEIIRPRGGSTSPPGEGTTETSSSGSEGSPELRGEKLSCPGCSRGYATVAGLSRHQQFHCLKDANRTYVCKYCPKTYTSMGALKMHIRTHTLPCKCHICGKAFSRPWLLHGHIRTHTGEKPFECQYCQRSFADRSNLRAHLQTHADVKKYACASCPKTFSRMSLLLKHQDNGCPGAIRPKAFSIAAVSPSSPV